MKYTAEEVRARVKEAWQNHDEQGRVFITMGDAMALVETILPERIKALDGTAQGGVTDGVVDVVHDTIFGHPSFDIGENGFLGKPAVRAALLAVWPNPPAQAAQLVDIEAIREVIESHINEAKKLRHDPESQDYLYEQAGKLEAAIKGESS